MDYSEMLNRAYQNLPENIGKKERFEIPKIKGHIQGNKTIISNFLQIMDLFQREPKHGLKFLQKELAAPMELQNQFLIIGTKKSSSDINDKIQKYADTFVICQECGKPDTKFVKEGQAQFMKCLACGAKKVIKSNL